MCKIILFPDNHVLHLIVCLILTVCYLPATHAVTDAELVALEKQIEQQEAEDLKQAEDEATRKVEAKKKAEEEAKRKAELKKQQLEEAKRVAKEKLEAEEAQRHEEAEAKRVAVEKRKVEETERIAEEKLKKLGKLFKLNKLLKKHQRKSTYFEEFSVLSLVSEDYLSLTSYQTRYTGLAISRYRLVEVSKLKEQVGKLISNYNNVNATGVTYGKSVSDWDQENNGPEINSRVCNECSCYIWHDFFKTTDGLELNDEYTCPISSHSNAFNHEDAVFDLVFYRVNKEDEKIIIEALSEVFD